MNGICENGIQIRNKLLKNRNQCRSIYVSNNTDDGFSFFRGEERRIEFDFHDMETRTLRINANHTIDTDDDNDTLDIGLFHEMLHWFHYLRNPKRYTNSDAENPGVYKYALRSYYGDPSELCTWGSAVDEEEIRVILGTPDYRKRNHLSLIPQEAFLTVNPVDGVLVKNGGFIPFESKFLEGDDLSENAYRMLVRDSNGSICRMRFGHGQENINPVEINQGRIPNRFTLAHLVATDCYREITGQPVQNWNLVSGQAAQ